MKVWPCRSEADLGHLDGTQKSRTHLPAGVGGNCHRRANSVLSCLSYGHNSFCPVTVSFKILCWLNHMSAGHHLQGSSYVSGEH